MKTKCCNPEHVLRVVEIQSSQVMSQQGSVVNGRECWNCVGHNANGSLCCEKKPSGSMLTCCQGWRDDCGGTCGDPDRGSKGATSQPKTHVVYEGVLEVAVIHLCQCGWHE
eukprot:6058420-Amphidinium_carterae.1